MNKLYLGLDIGLKDAKGVIVDKYDNIVASCCMSSEGDTIKVVKKVIGKLKESIDLSRNRVMGVGVTGMGKKLAGLILSATVIKNEIDAMVYGTVKMYPDVRTIMEIGVSSSKIILLKNGSIYDYSINNSCMGPRGELLDIVAKKMNICVNDVYKISLNSKNKIDFSDRCMVFMLSEIGQKMQQGYNREDILAGISRYIAKAYVNNVIKGKKIIAPIVFNGGLGRNKIVIDEISNMINEEIIVNKNAHLMCAYGVALIARDTGVEREFNFDIDDKRIDIRMLDCNLCKDKCTIMAIYENDRIIDHYGNKCFKGEEIINT